MGKGQVDAPGEPTGGGPGCRTEDGRDLQGLGLLDTPRTLTVCDP